MNDRLDMDKGLISKYAVLIRKTKLHLYQSPDIPIENGGGGRNCEEITADAGTLIKIFQTKARGSKSYSTVQVVDLVSKLPIYENLYNCPHDNLRRVDEGLWPFVISIVDPQQRLRLIQDETHCKWLMYLTVNQLVSVSGEMFGTPGIQYDCIIRYIGPVFQMQPYGYFFGLELLHLDLGISPQHEKVPFSIEYMQCDPTLSIFTTGNWLTSISKEAHKQRATTAREFITDTYEKVKSAIGPSSSITGSSASNTSSLKREKKAKKNKEATSQFYGKVLEDTTDNNNKEMDRKKDKSIANANNKEAIKQIIESYESSLERRATNTVHTQTQPQTGILKNKSKDRNKPIIHYDDRDIVVIDNEDIDESTRHEADIIVVEKPRQDVELMELLGSDWPRTAGDAAAILNKQSSARSVGVNVGSGSGGGGGGAASNDTLPKNNRKKSSNPLPAHSGGNSANDITDNKKMPNAKDQQEFLPAVLDRDFIEVSSLKELPNTGLEVGSMVEINVPEVSKQLYGVIRWIGIPPDVQSIMIGVELEDDHIDKQLITTDGGFNGISLFKCPAGRAIFITSDQCSIDRRFLGVEGAVGNDTSAVNDHITKTTNGLPDDQQTFGAMDCPAVPGAVPPIKCFSFSDLEELCGKFKGIQGHHNSCYLDVTLFAMFTFTPVFDALLYRPPEKNDISHYSEVQTVLREEIVNPLRKNMFVRADRVMKLRQLLDKLSSVSGLTSEEKDPEEFLNCLLSQIMRAEPLLKLNSGQDAYYYQLFVEKDERLVFPSVQQLFEQSFYTSDIKLKEVPSCLIIQMPRFGKNYKMYPRILPSQVLDVTDIIDDSPRQCCVCGKLAEFECRDCFGVLQGGVGLESTSLCEECLATVHMHSKRANHTPRKLSVPLDFRVMAKHFPAGQNMPRLYMELFAVVCIETSHYVTFVKAGSGPDAPWCFFDSMADRKGELNGYNIPEMITVPDLPQWLSEDGARTVNETSSNDKMLPKHAKRLFCDAYMCMYQSTDVMMYR